MVLAPSFARWEREFSVCTRGRRLFNSLRMNLIAMNLSDYCGHKAITGRRFIALRQINTTRRALASNRLYVNFSAACLFYVCLSFCLSIYQYVC